MKMINRKSAIAISLMAALSLGIVPATAAFAEEDGGVGSNSQLDNPGQGSVECDAENAVAIDGPDDVELSLVVGTAVDAAIDVEFSRNAGKATRTLTPGAPDGLTAAFSTDKNVVTVSLSGTPTKAGNSTHVVYLCVGEEFVTFDIDLKIKAAPVVVVEVKKLAETGTAGTLELGALALLLLGAGVVAQQVARRRRVKA
jgi:hypothetical protein